MAKVKCRYCGSMIDKKNAYPVKHGKQNWYYCNLEHSLLRTDKQLAYDKAMDIIGKTTNSIFFKEMDEIASVHGYKKLHKYLVDNDTFLNDVMNKDFSSEYAKIRYFSTVIKNRIGDYNPQYDSKQKDVEIEDVIETVAYKKRSRVGLEDLIEGYFDD